jgi:hyperosmotically inducible periplasmic protein
MIQRLLPSNGTVMSAPFVTTCVLFGTLLAPVVVIAHDADCSRPATFVQNSVVTGTIKTKLAAESLVRLEGVHVAADMDGVVWLSGSASSQEALDKAVAIARATECVRAVHSEIKITKHGPADATPPSAQPGPRAGDRGVQEAVGLSLALALLSGAGVAQR